MKLLFAASIVTLLAVLFLVTGCVSAKKATYTRKQDEWDIPPHTFKDPFKPLQGKERLP